MVKRVTILVALAVAAGVAVGMAFLFAPPIARAGIGPAGFAYYARQGILHGISLAYGLGHSPYTVKCQDHPNYLAQLGQITDRVTCQIRLKP